MNKGNMNYLNKLIGDIECHDISGIKECFENGVSPNDEFDGKPLIYTMINMYLRSQNFKKCVKTFVDFGLQFDDKILLYTLLDDAENLSLELEKNPQLINMKYSFPCTFTPLIEASLLHICAEYNHNKCAKVLINNRLDINVRAGFDENGLGGQSAIFHTVNQHNNNSLEMLKFLIDEKADLNINIKGLIWGKGYDWETYIPEVNPTSYAMMGLLRQFQRTEIDIYETVSIIEKANYGKAYLSKNIPNKYLNS